MKLIYCATPSRLASETTRILDYVTSKGLAPFHPFQAFEFSRFEGGPIGRGKTLEFCCRALEICDEFWLFGLSKGTLFELSHLLKWNATHTSKKHTRYLYSEFDPEWARYSVQLESEFRDTIRTLPISRADDFK